MTDEEINTRLSVLGLILPEPAAPVAAYVSVVVAQGFAHVSGQLSIRDGNLITGRLGDSLDLPGGVAAAQASGLMMIAQLRTALGSLARIERVVKLGVFVNSAADFIDQPKVANGESELMVALLGEPGRHARSDLPA